MTIRRTSRSKFDMSIQFFHFEFFFFSSLLSFFGSIPGGLWQISLRNPFDGSLGKITLLDKWHLANPSWTGRLNNVPETGRLRKLMRRINRIFGNELCILIGWSWFCSLDYPNCLLKSKKKKLSLETRFLADVGKESYRWPIRMRLMVWRNVSLDSHGTRWQ